MSDAALIGFREPVKGQLHQSTDQPHPTTVRDGRDRTAHQEHHQNDTHKSSNVIPTIQSEAVKTLPDGSTSRVTTDGSVVRSDDPTTHPNASMGTKLKGNLKGAINGTVGSMQATAGVVTRNEALEQKGLNKMAEEDTRLGTKHGVMPVGSQLRETKE